MVNVIIYGLIVLPYNNRCCSVVCFSIRIPGPSSHSNVFSDSVGVYIYTQSNKHIRSMSCIYYCEKTQSHVECGVYKIMQGTDTLWEKDSAVHMFHETVVMLIGPDRCAVIRLGD